MSLGIEYAKRYNADLLLATDPDCDRVGIAVKDVGGEFVLLTGNETGILLLDYICSRRIEYNRMPNNPVMVKTIVTIDMAKKIADKYGVKTIDVLTGFKFIGEQIGLLQENGAEDSYIFGFEESYGYLSGSYVRDKDAVNASLLICEMFAFYKSKGISLLDKLSEIYSEFGYCLNTLHSLEFEGESGFNKMQKIMQSFKEGLEAIANRNVIEILDYNKGLNGLPKSNVIKFILEGNSSVVVRPSGTEPKIKLYFSISAKNKETAIKIENECYEFMKDYIYG
jgi:phosphoglucomutase